MVKRLGLGLSALIGGVSASVIWPKYVQQIIDYHSQATALRTAVYSGSLEDLTICVQSSLNCGTVPTCE